MSLKDPTTGKAGRKNILYRYMKCNAGVYIDKYFKTYHTKKMSSECLYYMPKILVRRHVSVCGNMLCYSLYYIIVYIYVIV